MRQHIRLIEKLNQQLVFYSVIADARVKAVWQPE